MQGVLLGLVVVEAGAVAVLVVLWQRALHRVDRLESQLEEATVARRWVPARNVAKAVFETAALVRDVREKGMAEVLRSSIDDLAWWAEAERPDLARMADADGTVTIFFSDIEGSTALNHELGDKQWLKVLSRHDAVLRRNVEAHSGHVIKTQGDGFMVAFAKAEEGVHCAVDVQRSLSKERRRPQGPPIRVRIGVHKGEAVHRDGDLFGRNVAFAARVAAAADGGEIVVSDEVRDALAGDEQLRCRDEREIELKGFPGVHRVHTLDWVA